MAERMAIIWYVTKDNSYGDRAAAVAGRFAQVFPEYAVRYDYPNAPKRFFPANQKWPYEGLVPYRGAKWNWWAYNDIPDRIMNIYDILMSGYDWKRMDKITGPETARNIAENLLRLGYEFTAANPEVYSNMSPGMYRDMISVGRVLGDPAMVHEGVKRFREFFSTGFFADGWWKEGTTSYHDQTIRGLQTVADAFKGYSDPPGWKGGKLENTDLTMDLPVFFKALQVSREAVMPDGRKIPINDTWGRNRGERPDSTFSRLWPSLGDAAIGTGKGENQIMLNVNWSGNYGHSHYDNGSIILFAAGEELLPDIGYTHTRYRGWTTHTASHNTVVIDQRNQDPGTQGKPATGKLLFYDDENPHVKVIDVDASPAYSMAGLYRRRLVMVHVAPGIDYIIDVFRVEGGQEHDWFLHGMCEQEGTLITSIPVENRVESLVPDWGGRNKPLTQYDTEQIRFHAYQFLSDIKTAAATGPFTATWKYEGSGLRAHIFPPEGAKIFRFRSPSIRLAGEDENKLENHYSTGLMQRHSGKASTFTAVYEPFRKSPLTTSVIMKGNIITVTYDLKRSTVKDRITMGEEAVTVTSSAGWKYTSGKAFTGKVEAVETTDGKCCIVTDRQLPQVKFVRLDLPDGSTIYCRVTASEGKRLILGNDPGLTMEPESGKIIFRSFPHNEYKGCLLFTLFTQPE
jgi:hypothetical protein